MKPDYITPSFLDEFISRALAEDVGDGDHSSLAAIPADADSRARLLVKESCMLAGITLAREIFARVDQRLTVQTFFEDGARAQKGDVAFVVSGPARAVLTAERLVLNCAQRMSAIATKTANLSAMLKGTRATLLDTRKTTPNFRLLEKWAVLIGGGKNHRMGLFDMIMLKDNHIDMAGGIEQAIIRTKDYLRATKRNLRIEVETRSLQEVKEVLRVGGVDVIMLDNMSLVEMKEAVALIGTACQTEASGGISEETIRSVAECGVDFISVGALTHTVKSADLSLKAF